MTLAKKVLGVSRFSDEKLFKDLNDEGYTRARVNKEILKTDDEIKLERYKKHDIEIVIDRIDSKDIERLNEACENALKKSEGLIIVLDKDNKEQRRSKLNDQIQKYDQELKEERQRQS